MRTGDSWAASSAQPPPGKDTTKFRVLRVGFHSIASYIPLIISKLLNEMTMKPTNPWIQEPEWG